MGQDVRRILVVEDNDIVAAVLEKSLLVDGYTVVRARDGLEAMQYYDPQKIDLVVTDLVMPGKEGVELISELCRLNPTVRIVAMSGVRMAQSFLKLAQIMGAKALLLKPFTRRELKFAISEAIREA